MHIVQVKKQNKTFFYFGSYKMIEIKNKELKKEVYDKLDVYDKLAISHYMMGEMTKGKIYEKIGDKIYKKNYYKIYKRK